MVIFMNNQQTFSHLLYEIHIKVFIINVCCYGENHCFPLFIMHQFIQCLEVKHHMKDLPGIFVVSFDYW